MSRVCGECGRGCMGSHAHLIHGGEDEADALLVHGEHLRRVVVGVELADVHAQLAQQLRLRARTDSARE